MGQDAILSYLCPVCALKAGAGYLVTEDKDLLVLENYEGTRICQPVEFIAVLEAAERK